MDSAVADQTEKLYIFYTVFSLSCLEHLLSWLLRRILNIEQHVTNETNVINPPLT